jgi:hypothetical protein
MTDNVSVRKRAFNLDKSPAWGAWTQVVINVDDDTQASAGSDAGRTIEISTPFGTESMAQSVLARIKNRKLAYQYQPYAAENVLLDPAAEMGDSADINGIHGGIFTNDLTFSRLMAANISAPQDEEINHEYKFESPSERKFKREVGDVKATLLIQSNLIAAKVDNRQDNQSFGWELLQDHWSVVSNGNEVFRVDESGGTFSGNVAAQTGTIGGFTISATAIYNNLSSFNGSQTDGVYIGTDGIQLGQKFRVDTAGNAKATRLEVDTLVIGGTPVSASTLNSRANSAYASTTSGGYCFSASSAWNNSITANTSAYPSYFTCGRLRVMSGGTLYGSVGLASDSFYLGSHQVTRGSIKDGNGNTQYVLKWA